MFECYPLASPQGTRAVINKHYHIAEENLVKELIKEAEIEDLKTINIKEQATCLITKIRIERKKKQGIDSLLTQYSLSSEEGIALMCLAEALLRVPDKATIDSLIKDKLTSVDWRSHQGQSDSFFINATTWALILTGKVLTPEKANSALSKALFKLLNRSGEAVIRGAVNKAMQIMSKQFVMGRTIKEALVRAKNPELNGYRYSYDMLGEAALTASDAERYFTAYYQAIELIGASVTQTTPLYQRPGISVKLSALHPRYQETQRQKVCAELSPKVLILAQLAKRFDIAFTIDAEESERLDLSLDVIEQVFSDESLSGWLGFGVVVQAYQKRAFYVLDWLADLARSKQRRIMVRLVKGAYWDSEIKKAQVQGFSDYPVFTHKSFTDISYQACAKKILTLTEVIFPQFATHNAYTLATILNLAGNYRDFEFQCLHGMGKELYEQVVPVTRLGIPCRIYAPVGSHEDLLPYLVRRLLENGANSSFVHQVVDEKLSISSLVEDPLEKAKRLLKNWQYKIPLPASIFLPDRKNSKGFDFTDRLAVANLQHLYEKKNFINWQAKPLVGGEVGGEVDKSVSSPQNPHSPIGRVSEATSADIEKALAQAEFAFILWGKTSVNERVGCIERFASLLEKNTPELLALTCLEAGKTCNDSIAEIREAVDFCYYYAKMAEKLMTKPTQLRGYTGEINEHSLHPRGVVLCISPWNFPLAIFTGQVVAALVTGNCVIAKPAEQTPLIAAFAVQLLHEAGVPVQVIQLLPGAGEEVGAALVADTRVKAILFTGSTQTATAINKQLASRGGEIIPLIAETGGQNAMIVDSSALLEQVVMDVLVSAFGSAGQRCSALRVLYLQEEIYPRTIELLKGAMAELVVGDPRWLATDIGPVIDNAALQTLQAHVERMLQKYQLIYQSELPADNTGYFMPPTAIAIDSIHALEGEIFGPILHVISYNKNQLDKVIEQINSTGFGLTLGIHSRINQTITYIKERINIGNCYVNRNMIGAVVGLQPFGGERMSGTGPKAGGPYYLIRLCHERTYTIDTTAAGGNASLMSMSEGGY